MRINIKPKEGFIVRDPKTYKALPAAGKYVEPNQYWNRRIKAGDVVVIKSTKPNGRVK